MTEFEKLAKEKLKLITRGPELLADGAIKAQRDAWEKILDKIQDLDIKNGRIAQTSKNFKIIEEVANIMKGALGSVDYQKALVSFVKDIDQSALLSNRITNLIVDFTPGAAQKQFLEIAKRGAVETLLGDNITGTAVSEIRDALTASVASGASFKETVKALKPIVIGEGEGDGKLLGRIRTYAMTTQGVVDSSYTAMIAESIGAEWFFWAGTEIPTSRQFCKLRHDQYFHKKEIESWGNGDDPTNIGGINDEGNWGGKAENTNSHTIFALKGGWNCRHSPLPVSLFMVPRSVVDRAISAGFYKEN